MRLLVVVVWLLVVVVGLLVVVVGLLVVVAVGCVSFLPLFSDLSPLFANGFPLVPSFPEELVHLFCVVVEVRVVVVEPVQSYKLALY